MLKTTELYREVYVHYVSIKITWTRSEDIIYKLFAIVVNTVLDNWNLLTEILSVLTKKQKITCVYVYVCGGVGGERLREVAMD